MVYLVGNKDFGVCKIGFTTNLSSRVKGIQTGFPYKLEVLGVLKGQVEDEMKLHQQFKHLRLEGEWFTYTEDILMCFEFPRMAKRIAEEEAQSLTQVRHQYPQGFEQEFLKAMAEQSFWYGNLMVFTGYDKKQLNTKNGWGDWQINKAIKTLCSTGHLEKVGRQEYKPLTLPLDFIISCKRGRPSFTSTDS